MPPRFPHGLVRPPSKMDKSELAVFTILGASVAFGLFRMGSDVFFRVRGGGEKEEESDPDSRDRALDAIGKCDLHLRNFGKCAQDNGLLVLVKCRDMNAKIKDCMKSERDASPGKIRGSR
ncbi:hypothetical protein ACHAW5_009055 [Stephanodiscus triporus]|uniref:COX assembly mitochondrial protein n=1 Tax=Stephanodiscus triporus TaxID=2934178 RepID=A0ABD3PC13_9STRA